MRMDELAAPAIEVVRDGRVRIHPESQSKRYIDWLENIRPWCISRQLWWGHQIPVWYRGDEVHCGVTAPEGEGWTRDPDVLDTWFSSALWPFATLGWPEETAELRAFYPTDVLSTARDILFLWVARMVMMGLRFTGDVPFTDVYIHSVIQAPDGRRMSKSLGTGIDPLDLIDGGPRPPVFAEGGDFPAYGADAVRFGLLAMSSTQDVRFSEEKIAQGQALANKLFNATRFVLLRIGDDVEPAPRPRTVEDRWILSRLQAIEADTQARIDGFDFSKAALGLYDFVYGELCDWYLELVKPRLGDDADPGDRAALGATLLHVLRETLATAHPVIPFVTEELWELLGWTEAEGLLAAVACPSPTRRCATAPPRRRWAARSRRSRRCAAGATPSACRPARSCRASCRRPGTRRPRARSRRSRAWSCATAAQTARSRSRRSRSPAAPSASWRPTPSTSAPPTGAGRRSARRSPARSRAPRASSPTRASSPRRPDAVVDAEREKLERLRAELEALPAPSRAEP